MVELNGPKTDDISKLYLLYQLHTLLFFLAIWWNNQGELAHFEAMRAYMKELESPILLAIGNHETRYQSTFTPGYKCIQPTKCMFYLNREPFIL
ncbi:hypothetical protein [Cyclobacterium amurskyense]|uniref:hypothetical protein n=1 Tax=Cyclobacterium amurskyense TaxID=320787 RepID=UPI00065E7EAB|nr:hypothetical protein [Cyclobacterium amurskyense]